jgi:hypothetical protein
MCQAGSRSSLPRIYQHSSHFDRRIQAGNREERKFSMVNPDAAEDAARIPEVKDEFTLHNDVLR